MGKEKCFVRSVFVLKKKGGSALLKDVGTGTSLRSHVEIVIYMSCWNMKCIWQVQILQHAHTERDSFLMAISHPMTSKSVAKRNLQESPFCNILKGEPGRYWRERRRNISTAVMLSLHLIQNHSTKNGKHLY